MTDLEVMREHVFYLRALLRAMRRSARWCSNSMMTTTMASPPLTPNRLPQQPHTPLHNLFRGVFSGGGVPLTRRQPVVTRILTAIATSTRSHLWKRGGWHVLCRSVAMRLHVSTPHRSLRKMPAMTRRAANAARGVMILEIVTILLLLVLQGTLWRETNHIHQGVLTKTNQLHRSVEKGNKNKTFLHHGKWTFSFKWALFSVFTKIS